MLNGALLSSQNYGDESGAYGLMYPSIYSNRGVYEDEFFAPRSPEEVGGMSLSGSILRPTVILLPYQHSILRSYTSSDSSCNSSMPAVFILM